METFTSSEISAILFEWLYKVCSNCVYQVVPRLRDSSYVLPTKASVEKSFADDLWRFQKATKMWRDYVDEAMDCDNYAIVSNAVAAMKHNSQHLFKSDGLKRPIKSGLAFGSVFYRPGWFKGKEQGYHIANIFITVENGKYKVLGFEPQSCRVFEFTKEEIHTIRYIEMS